MITWAVVGDVRHLAPPSACTAHPVGHSNIVSAVLASECREK